MIKKPEKPSFKIYCTIEKIEKDGRRVHIWRDLIDEHNKITHEFASADEMDKYLYKCLIDKRIYTEAEDV